MIPTAAGPALDEQIDWARAAWECPAIRRLRASSTAPLTPGRFVRNIVDSFTNTRLRIPPDPETAYRKFCGEAARPSLGRARSPGTPRLTAPPDASRSSIALGWNVQRRKSLQPGDRTTRLPLDMVALAGFV